MPKRHLAVLAVTALTVAAVAGCAASTASRNPSSGASASLPASPSSASGGIEYPTGAADIVLRYEEGGGFVRPDFLATTAPIFTLYGDRTVVFRDPTQEPPPANDNVMRQNPFKTAQLSEEQMQDVLEFALNEGGLGVAREKYDHAGIADASSAFFTVSAGQLKKTVEVYALGMGGPGTPDEVMRRAFQTLAERLRTFDQGGSLPTAEYAPKAYRGVLSDGTGMDATMAKAWPWPGVKVADFTPPDPNGGLFSQRAMTAEEVAQLGIDNVAGGVQGLILKGPDGKLYAFALRPLLPDEKS